MCKPTKLLTLAGCLALAALGGVLPFVGWMFLVAALHTLVSEFETGRDWIRNVRRRWPFLSRQIVRARCHPWAPDRLQKFDELTDPLRNA
jgi:hypothetical protein